MMSEIETRLSDSRVSYNSVVDYKSRRPVLSPLEERMRPEHWLRSVLRVSFNALTLLVG